MRSRATRTTKRRPCARRGRPGARQDDRRRRLRDRRRLRGPVDGARLPRTRAVRRGNRRAPARLGRVGPGGQAITGFAKDEEVERQLGADGARAAWSLSLDGVALIAERIARYGIDCDFTRGYLTVATKPRRIDDLHAWMDAATQRWGHPSLSWLDTGEIRARIASTRYLAGVYDPLSGHHPLKYCLGSRCRAANRAATLTPALDVVRAARRPVVHAVGRRALPRRVVQRGLAACCRPRRPPASRRSRRPSSRPSRSAGARRR